MLQERESCESLLKLTRGTRPSRCLERVPQYSLQCKRNGICLLHEPRLAPLMREIRELAEADAKKSSAIAMAQSSYLMQLAIQAVWGFPFDVFPCPAAEVPSQKQDKTEGSFSAGTWRGLPGVVFGVSAQPSARFLF